MLLWLLRSLLPELAADPLPLTASGHVSLQDIFLACEAVLSRERNPDLDAALRKWLVPALSAVQAGGPPGLLWTAVGLSSFALLLPPQPVDPTAKHALRLATATTRADVLKREVAVRLEVRTSPFILLSPPPFPLAFFPFRSFCCFSSMLSVRRCCSLV